MARRDWLFLSVLGIIGLVFLYLALIWSPPEATMGNLVRIMYFHVSSAWVAFLSFGVTGLASLWYLWRRAMPADWIAVSSAEIGVFYTSVTLISGSLWARPVWNTWWTWDPRLTTTLILWFLYVGYLLLRGTIARVQRRAVVSAVYAIIALVDVPIIHFSVSWWRSIHPTVISETGFHMPGSMVTALMFGFLAFLCIYLMLLYVRVRQESQQFRMNALREKVQRVRRDASRRQEYVQ